MPPMKTETFDAVTEARRWKAAVAEKTQGLTREQVLAFFDKQKAMNSMAQMRQVAGMIATAKA